MSDLNNPFQSPQADINVIKPLVNQSILTEVMIKHLSDASPWLRFMGIMGFIGCGCMVMGGIIFLFLIPFGINLLGESSEILSNLIGPMPLMIGHSLYLMGAGVLMFFPALFTYSFGQKIRSFILTNIDNELELAFGNNKSLWKFNGILMIIMLAFIPVLVIMAIIVAVAVLAIL